MSAHPPDLCPLCAQRALALNTAGTLLTCAACGAQAEFEGSTRRVRYTRVPQAFARFDGPLRGRWLTRSEVFDVVAVLSPPRIKRRWPWAIGLALLGGVGVIGLVATLAGKLPAQPQVRPGSTRTAEVRSVGLSTSSAKPGLANTSAVIVTATSQPPQVAAVPTEVSITVQPVQAATALPTLVATPVAPAATSIASVVLFTPTAQPQPNNQIVLPTVDTQPGTPAVSTQPTSSPTPVANIAPTATAIAIPSALPQDIPAVNTPMVAQTPSAIVSERPTSVATPTTAPEQTPTDIAPTETSAPTVTSIPTPTQTPVPATLSISNIAYVGGSTFEEYLELKNATDQVMELPIYTWKLRISTAVGATELTLGTYLSEPISLPAGLSCRIYTSKRAASAGEASPCGFLTLGIVDDIDGLYPDKPGVTVTLVNDESQMMGSFRY